MLDFSHVLNNPNADVQSFFAPSIPTIATNLASVTLATGGVLTVPSGSYYVGQVIQITGTFSAGSITGYVSGNYYYVITVTSATSITISATPGGTAVTSTAGTATPGATFNIVNTDWYMWTKPRGAKWIYMMTVGAGASGAGGIFTGASAASVGAAGGASGAQAVCMMPAIFVPDTLYIHVGLGGRPSGTIVTAMPAVNGTPTCIAAEPTLAPPITFCP